MLIGYARVSTDDQNINLQRDALQQAGCTQICEDHIIGAKSDRPGPFPFDNAIITNKASLE